MACNDLGSGKPVRLDGRGLMLGILTAYYERPPFGHVADADQLKQAAVDVASTMREPAFEVAVLNAAAYIRERHGLAPSRVALVTAATLCPESTSIRADLIATCWSMLKSADDELRQRLLEQIAQSYQPADIPIIRPEAVQQTLYAVFIALHFLPDRSHALTQLLASDAIRLLVDDWYVSRVRYLLAHPSSRVDEFL